MQDSGWANSKICTCTYRLSNSFAQKKHELRANFCSNCGARLTFTQCERCNGTGHGECSICHGFVSHGCSTCSGTGFAPVPHECPPQNNGWRVDDSVLKKPPIVDIGNSCFNNAKNSKVNDFSANVLRKDLQFTKCSICNGTGNVSLLYASDPIGRSVKCLTCKGTGWVKSASNEGQDESIVTNLPKRTSLSIKCLACNGTGKVSLPSLNSQVDCLECKGKGWIESPSSGDESGGVGWLFWLIGGLIFLGMVL